jgi:hypothetical protein
MKSLFLILLFVGLATAKNVEVKTDDGILKGTLEETSDKSIAVLIISGSGPTDRNGNSSMMTGDNNSLKMLAEELKDNGFASLRYDKRMIGESQGFPPESEMTFNDFVEDAVAWVELLESRGYEKIVIAGHSEGSLIGTLAAQRTNADGFISICGLAKNMGETIIEQLSQRMPMIVDDAKKIVDSLKAGKKIKVEGQILQSMFRESIQDFMIDVLQYEPAQEIAKLDIPTLIINGKHDMQVPFADGEILQKSANEGKYYALDSMNHVLKNSPNDMVGNLQTYTNPNLPINQELIDSIIEYLKMIDK